MSDSLVKFREMTSVNGKIIAVAKLNAPQSLNALSLPMMQQLYHQLNLWRNDNNVVLVMLEGGDKAFCAGGDIVSLYYDLVEYDFPINDHDIENALAFDFFKQEYQLDQLIHNYPKPVLAWASGYVMGGGIGLVAGASHKVTTENSIFAMPEVSIGLYPDVGASYFLNKMPNKLGSFLGITGATFNSADALNLGLSDHFIEHSNKELILNKLKSLDWQNEPMQNSELLTSVLIEQAKESENKLPLSILAEHENEIDNCLKSTHLTDIYNAILGAESGSSWFNKVKGKLKSASPLSVAITYRLLQENKDLSLSECFEREWQLSIRCSQFGEFSEGVRALLVDKDRTPNWSYKSLSQIDQQRLDWFFS